MSKNTSVDTAPELSSVIPARPKYFRASDGVYMLNENPWGSHYVKIPDPKGKPKPAELEEFWLNPNFSKLPAHLLQAIITLFRHYLHNTGDSKGKCTSKHVDATTEVQVCLLRSQADDTQWKVVVPKQVVGSVTVDAVLAESCDILTGEEYKVFPPTGYIHAGSVHSHHTMASFWSGRDDQGELGVPGMHCTVGRLTQEAFSICCSIVLNKTRYVLEAEDCLDLRLATAARPITNDRCHSWMISLASCEINPKVHKYITKARPYVPKASTAKINPKSFSSWSKSTDAPASSHSYWDTHYNPVDWRKNVTTDSYKRDDYTGAEGVLDFLSSSALRTELNMVTDLIYAAANNRYPDLLGVLSGEEQEALSVAKDFLVDLFEVMSSCRGNELAILEALAIAFDLELNDEIIEVMDTINL